MVFGGFSQAFCCSSLAWGVGVSSCRWVLWFSFSCLGSSTLGVLFFQGQALHSCASLHVSGTSFHDRRVLQHGLRDLILLRLQGSLRIVSSFPTQSHPSTPSSSFSSWMWMLETPKKRGAEVLRGLHKHPKFSFFLVIVFRHLACKSRALANEIYTF